MNSRSTLLIAAGVLVLLSVMGTLGFFTITAKTNTPAGVSGGGTLPISLPNNSTSQVPSGSGTASTTEVSSFMLRTTDGNIQASDFTKSSGVASTSDESFLTWIPATGEYQVFYLPSDQSFEIVLLKEPIAEARRHASDDLQSRLGISAKETCSLIAEISVPYEINSFYAVQNLGFPGCPGAVRFEGD